MDARRSLSLTRYTISLRDDQSCANRRWDDLSIKDDIGVSEASIPEFAILLAHENARRPAASRYDDEELAEKMLESIKSCSAHLHETASTELDAPIGQRIFEYPAPHPQAGQRELRDYLFSHALQGPVGGGGQSGPHPEGASPARQEASHSEAGRVSRCGRSVIRLSADVLRVCWS